MIDCARFETLLDDPRAAARVEEHAAACERCAETLRLARRLAVETEQLKTGIAPARDLWPGIERRLFRPRRTWLPAAAVAAVAAMILLLATWQPWPGAPTGRPGETLAAERDVARLAEARYLEATRELMATLDRRRESLSPAALATVEENIEIIDRAIGEVQRALQAGPRDPRNEHMMNALYRRKLDLLWRFSRLSS